MDFTKISQNIQSKCKSLGIKPDDRLEVFTTALHKGFYLKFAEFNNDESIIDEFCGLTECLKHELQYGVSTDWSHSELNRYVYLHDKEKFEKQWPRTHQALSRFHNESSLRKLYENLGCKSPAIIDLVGTTGAGKTTFCQMFVDKESRNLLENTITTAGESTVVQTDIVILPNKPKRMFLRVRSKRDIMRDILITALQFNGDKLPCNNTIMSCVKNSNALNRETVTKVSQLYSSSDLFESFCGFAAQAQKDYAEFKASNNNENGNTESVWIYNCLENGQHDSILDLVVEPKFGSENDSFYGYRKEFDLEVDGQSKVIDSITDQKLDDNENPERVSYRLLYDHAILVLSFGQDAIANIKDFDFAQGIVFRDSQGHVIDEQYSIATDMEISNKVFLIPVDTGGYLIDKRYSNIFDKILVSDPKTAIFVITKMDSLSIYRDYIASDYSSEDEFKSEFKKKWKTTHKNLINVFNNNSTENENGRFAENNTKLFENFMTAFSNAYISEINPKKYDAEAHRLVYTGIATEPFEMSKADIKYVDGSWFEMVAPILKQYKTDYNAVVFSTNKQNPHKDSYRKIKIDLCALSLGKAVDYFISDFNWQEQLNSQTTIPNVDYRSIYGTAQNWFNNSFRNDNSNMIDKGYFIDFVGIMIYRVSHRYIVEGTKNRYFETAITEPINNYLSAVCSENSSGAIQRYSHEIAFNAFKKAVKAAYKIYNRDLFKSSSYQNFRSLYTPIQGRKLSPTTIAYNELNFRYYDTLTEFYASIYLNLLSTFKSNMQTHLIDMFKVILNEDLAQFEETLR